MHPIIVVQIMYVIVFMSRLSECVLKSYIAQYVSGRIVVFGQHVLDTLTVRL